MKKLVLGGLVLSVFCAASASAESLDNSASVFSILGGDQVMALSEQDMANTYGKHVTINSPYRDDPFTHGEAPVHITVSITDGTGPTTVVVER